MIYNFSYLKKINGSRNLIHFNGFSACKDSNPTLMQICEEKSINYYSLEMPGQGECNISENDIPTIEYLVNYAVEFVKSLNLDKVIISGHSMGGLIALLVAYKLGNKMVEHVLLEDPVNDGLSKEQFSNLLIKLHGINTFPKLVDSEIKLHPMSVKQKEWFSQLASDLCNKENYSAMNEALMFSGLDITILFGELDVVVDCKNSLKYFDKFRKTRTYTIKYALHTPHNENKNEYLDIVNKILK